METVLDFITLTSPSGKTFKAKWIGDPVELAKKVAIFEYPGVDGARVQDLGISSSQMNLTIYFDGQFHAQNAFNFETALVERGAWDVKHPVRGLIKIQPLSIKPMIDPVGSGGVTKIDTTWIKYTPSYEGLTYHATALAIPDDVNQITKAIIATLPENAPYEAWVQNFSRKVRSVVASINKTYSKFWAIQGKFRTQLGEMTSSLKSLLTQPIIAISDVAYLLTQIISLPSKVETIVSTKIDLYKRLFNTISGKTIESHKTCSLGVSGATTHELVCSAIIGSMAVSLVNGKADSREDAYFFARELLETYNQFTTDCIFYQNEYTTQNPKNSYIFSPDTYTEMHNVVGTTINYVSAGEYANEIKKVITTKKTESTLEFAMKHYPNRSIEEAYDYLIATNKLTGELIINIPPNFQINLYLSAV